MFARRLVSVAALLSAAPAYAEATVSEPQAPPRAAPVEASAPPELAIGDAQLVLAPRRDLFDANSLDPYLRYAGFVQATGGGSAGGDLGAGVAAAVSGLGCDVVAGSVQGRLRPLADQRLVGEARWSICLSRIGLMFALDGHDGIGVAPAIDARRSLWSRRYDETYTSVTIGLGEGWVPGSPGRHSVFVVTLGHGTTAQSDGVDRRNIVELDLDFALYRYRHLTAQHELVVEAFVLTSDAIKAGDSNLGGVTYDVLPGRIKLSTGDAYFAAQGGVGFTGGSTTDSGSINVNGSSVDSWSEEIDGTGLPTLRTFVGSVTAGITRRQLDTSASISRSFYPTFDGNLALENRLSGSATWAGHRRHATSITLSPFIAQTETWTRDVGAAREVDFGASLRAGYALNDLVNLGAVGEAGRTPYARLNGARIADSFGGQLLVALTARTAN